METLARQSQYASGADPIRTVCCISVHESDKLRLTSFPSNLLNGIRTVVHNSWPHGIQSEETYGSSYQFKLLGRPWYGSGIDAVESRRIAVGIMRFMLVNGWVLEVATDISKKAADMDSWFFTKQTPEPQAVMCGISFNMRDRIRVIDGFPEVTQAVQASIQKHWPPGLQQYRTYGGVPEFQLYGNPWLAMGVETVRARLLIVHLIEELRGAGWRVYASVDISFGKGEDRVDLDSWILKRFTR